MVLESFKPTTTSAVHWDGKLMSDLMGTNQVDRLPILVSTMGEKKLLDIPKTKLHAVLSPMLYTVPFKNGDWRIWSVPCVSTRPVQTLAYYQKHVSFWSS